MIIHVVKVIRNKVGTQCLMFSIHLADAKSFLEKYNTQSLEADVSKAWLETHDMEKVSMQIYSDDKHQVPKDVEFFELEIDTSNCYYQDDSPDYIIHFYKKKI